MTLAGLSPAGALIVRAGEPFALQVGYVDEAGELLDLTGRTFALAIRYTDLTQPFLTINAELDGIGRTAVALATGAQATQIYEAGQARRLSYDFMELTGGVTASRLTERVSVQPGSEMPGEAIPQYMDVPQLSMMIAPQRKLVIERGRPGFGAEQRLYQAGYINEPTIEAMDQRYAGLEALSTAPYLAHIGVNDFAVDKQYPPASPGDFAKVTTRRFGNKFSPFDQINELIVGRPSSVEDELAWGAANWIALNDCIARMNHAKANGVLRPQLILPNEYFAIGVEPYIGTQIPGPGISAVGGAHYVGHDLLPLTQGWSAHGMIFDGMQGFDVISEGARIVRSEHDPYNNEDANDALHSSLFFKQCKDFRLIGEFFGEGFQVGEASTTSGNFIDISYGCEDVDIRALLQNWKGSNVLAIALNRAFGFSSAPGVGGYDINQPCVGINIDQVHSFVGEHACFMGPAADQWSINDLSMRFRPYAYKGVEQSNYIQRGLYLQNCGRGQVGRARIYDVHKAGVLIAAYDARRGYTDTDVTFGDVFVQAVKGQDANYHSAVEIYNHNIDPAHMRRVKAVFGKLTTRGVKSGLIERDDEVAALANEYCIERLHINSVDIEATANGIVLSATGRHRDIVIGDGTIKVQADPQYSLTSRPVQGLTVRSGAVAKIDAAVAIGGTPAGTPAAFTENVRTGKLLVESGNRAVTFGGVAGLTIEGLTANYVNEGVPGANIKPLTIDYSKIYGKQDYRTSDGSPASQQKVLEFAPIPMRGVFLRNVQTPLNLAPGASITVPRVMNGLRSEHFSSAKVVNQPSITVETDFKVNDEIDVTYTNRGSTAFVGTATTNIIAFPQQILGGS